MTRTTSDTMISENAPVVPVGIRSRSTSRSLILLATDVYGVKGGIAAYMRRLVDIFSAHCKSSNSTFQCVSLSKVCDSPTCSLPAGLRRFEVTPHKATFGVKAARQSAFQSAPMVVVGHLGLAPVAWGLKRLGLIRSYAVVLHGIEAWKRADLLDRIAAREADFIVSTTQFTGNEFAAHNTIKSERIRILPLGLQEDYVPQRLRNAPTGCLELLTVGRLVISESYKGVDTLIQSIACLREQGVKVRLTIVGDGDDIPRLQNIGVELGVETSLRFLRAISDSELQLEYQKCDVFAMPSKGEGFGIVFLEAMRYGKPCIGGNHGGTPEVIDHGVNGFLVNHHDTPQLTHYIRELAHAPSLIEQMGANAQRTVENRFLYPHLEKRWLAFLDEVLAV